jgi:hypothetical protein
MRYLIHVLIFLSLPVFAEPIDPNKPIYQKRIDLPMYPPFVLVEKDHPDPVDPKEQLEYIEAKAKVDNINTMATQGRKDFRRGLLITGAGFLLTIVLANYGLQALGMVIWGWGGIMTGTGLIQMKMAEDWSIWSTLAVAAYILSMAGTAVAMFACRKKGYPIRETLKRWTGRLSGNK